MSEFYTNILNHPQPLLTKEGRIIACDFPNISYTIIF